MDPATHCLQGLLLLDQPSLLRMLHEQLGLEVRDKLGLKIGIRMRI